MSACVTGDFKQSQDTVAPAAVPGWLLVRAIVRPIEEAVKIAGALAQGDLTRRIEVRANDETGRLMGALRGMSDSPVGIVARVRSGTDTMATASAGIADGKQDRRDHRAHLRELPSRPISWR